MPFNFPSQHKEPARATDIRDAGTRAMEVLGELDGTAAKYIVIREDAKGRLALERHVGYLRAACFTLLVWCAILTAALIYGSSVESNRWISAAELKGAYERATVKAFAKVGINFNPETGESKPLQETP